MYSHTLQTNDVLMSLFRVAKRYAWRRFDACVLVARGRSNFTSDYSTCICDPPTILIPCSIFQARPTG